MGWPYWVRPHPPDHVVLSFRYEGLGVKEIREFLDDDYPWVYEYLPEPNLELPKVPKQWFANVCATLLKEKFSQWVKHRSDNRHEYVAEKGDLNIEMDPEIADAYNKSNAVSSKCIPQPMILKIMGQLINLMFYSLQGSLRKSLQGRVETQAHQGADRGRARGRGAGEAAV